MTVLDDTVKGTTIGDPDGPIQFIESLGVEVPTFIDPRIDLIPPGRTVKNIKRVSYHIPFAYRGEFRPEQWPGEFRQKHAGSIRLSVDGFVLCTGVAKQTGMLCQNKAVNRTLFCRNHGGALHPADKKLSSLSIVPESASQERQDRIDKLDRVQKFMQGFLSVEELDDDEITGSFVRTSEGVPIKSIVLGKKFEQLIGKELHVRLNRYLTSKTPRALEVMYQIMDSEMVEPADRINAAKFIIERTMGKTPDVVISHKTEEKPYESILESIESGSRADHRKSVASTRLQIEGSYDAESEEDYAEEVDLSEVDDGNETSENGDSGSSGIRAGSDQGNQNVQNAGYGLGDGHGIPDGSSISAGSPDDVQKHADDLVAKRQKQRDLREAIKKARAKRFAARAVGGISGDDGAWLVEFRVISNVKSPDLGKYKVRFWPPDKITPAVIERVRKSNTTDLVDVLGARGELH